MTAVVWALAEEMNDRDDDRVDPVAEATAQAAAGSTTDPNDEPRYGGESDRDLTNGAEPDPDLAQGESD